MCIRDRSKLPGIGPALAERIISARPYNSMDEVTRVKGVNARLLEIWMGMNTPQPYPRPAPDHVTVSTTSKTDQADDSTVQSTLGKAKEMILEKGQAFGEKMSEMGESVKKHGKVVGQTAKALPGKFEKESKARGPLWTLLVSNGITALVSILLTLFILGVINGSLKYATGSQYRTIQSDVKSLTTQADLIQQDQASLRSRVDTLEGLGERIVSLEKAHRQLAADLDTASQQVSEMQSDVTSLTGKVDQQEERTLRFDTFLKELQALLGDLFAQGGTQ